VRPLEGEVVVAGRVGRRTIPLVAVTATSIETQYTWSRWIDHIVTEAYRPKRRPMSTRWPFHYQALPAALRNATKRMLLAGCDPKFRSPYAFPEFPIAQGFEVLYDVMVRLGWAEPVWPSEEVVLTHDIDTAEGFEWVRPLAEREMGHGYRSLWNVVGCEDAIDHGVLDWLVEQGFEIGLYGYSLDGRTPFMSESAIRRRLDDCQPLIDRYDIKSHRSPAWLRSERMYRVLRDYVCYDYSALDCDVFCPGGTGGCLWTRPFEHHGLTVVPTTVPFDELLPLDMSPAAIRALWQGKIEWLRACGGHIVVNTHCDAQRCAQPAMLDSYDSLLRDLQATPSAVVAFS
jgi:hypothetical protein